MPFIPHTEAEVRQMLDSIEVSDIEALFNEIPAELVNTDLAGIPAGASEMEIAAVMNARSNQDQQGICFIGAGAYDHYIPSAVWELTTRGEYYSAYTPYQAEASQGTLQLLYEYQSMMTGLTAMDVANASLYDGASALAEAVLMAVRCNRKSKSRTILVPQSVDPRYRMVTNAIVKNQNIHLQDLPLNNDTGITDISALPADPGDITAVVVPWPNFFGSLEDVNELTDWAHEHNALVIALVNPMALALLTPPGLWGHKGADIACGEGQALGIPLSSGGPYFGFMCCKQNHVRQMPGRIIGRTVDTEGNTGYTLTLQAREQHIRRSKATSNICTNQGLLVTAATIYMSIMGNDGVQRVARASHDNTRKLLEQVLNIKGITRHFQGPFFHEAVIATPKPAQEVLTAMDQQGIQGGFDLSPYYDGMENCILLCATEKRSDEEIQQYAKAISQALS